jgi:hypothetical protein
MASLSIGRDHLLAPCLDVDLDGVFEEDVEEEEGTARFCGVELDTLGRGAEAEGTLWELLVVAALV